MTANPPPPLAALQQVIERHWGYGTLRPLQAQAMQAVLDGRDSVVVLPTGGGKSLCYQAPAVLRGETTVVVSPLIALMKDQVDSLRACGVPAIQLDSTQSSIERQSYQQDLLQGALRLLFVSPERLVQPEFCDLLRRAGVRTFAIDEAHCISHWGHDFRPEYRQLRRLKELFPDAAVHAYTATATQRVRQDIIEQLGLQQAQVLVGNFDRPNLTYRVIPRFDVVRQVVEVIERHQHEAGIIYCLRRADVDALADRLQKQGILAQPYHAGMTPEARHATQEAFATEACDIVVATVAFGMGINRSNLRFVLHAAMPKSVEHYQQETGRAGRDGLEAECVLLHSGGDLFSWQALLRRSAGEPGVDPSFLPSALQHVEDMDRYARGAVCRHRALVEYFGQSYEPALCGACDICLGDAEAVPDAITVAQKILSCVARVKEKFGVGHVVSVLRGENTEAVRRWQHDQVSTYGLLKAHSAADVRDWVYQLLGQGVLAQEEIELANGKRAGILRLNDQSWAVMRKQKSVRLLQPVRRSKSDRPGRSQADAASWEGVDRGLFEALRSQRKQWAEARKVPPYVIFSDATLRELARVRPSSLEKMRLVYGIGDTKLRDFGADVLAILDQHALARGLQRDQPGSAVRSREPRPVSLRPNPQRDIAFDLFREGASIEQVMQRTGRARSTVVEYLAEFISETRPATISAWVSDATYARVAAVYRQEATDRLKPIFLALGEQVSYDEIRVVMSHLQSRAQ